MNDEDVYISLLTLALLSGVLFYVQNQALILSTLQSVLGGAG